MRLDLHGQYEPLNLTRNSGRRMKPIYNHRQQSISTFGAFAHKQVLEYNLNCLTSIPSPHTMLKLLSAISNDFPHCIGWGKGTVMRFLKRKVVLLSNLNSKTRTIC